MGLSDFNGNITTSVLEQTIFDIIGLKHYSSWIHLHNLQAGDSIQIRLYVLDPNTPLIRKYLDVLVADLQTTPAFYIPWTPSRQYRLTVQRISGIDRNITWSRQEQ